MKPDSQPLSTADLANTGTPPAESMIHQPEGSSAAERLDAEDARSAGVEKQEIVPQETQPASESQRPAPPSGEQTAGGSQQLFDEKDAQALRERWSDIQVGFVDEPRAAVQKADTLVAETIKRLADSFATSRRELEGEWDRAGDVSTETLRLALQRYRSFFNRLLTV
jgi:hypothetical protein